ncbi:MAG: hypothetical protein GY796_06650 [Chloroflexi bacterium]|nr:hypothetical protein [Chloroflexota bacterium]
MKHLKKMSLFLVLFLLLFGVIAAQAQTDKSGTIRGGVYQDVNGDGQCVNTGIAGENPVPGVTIQFVSSDKATVVTLTTGDNGTYGLAAAGQSIWEVTAQPDAAKWVVTSENPRFAYVLPETGLEQTGFDFCVSQGANAVIVLPQSGAAATNSNSNDHIFVVAAAVFGLALVGLGVSLEWQRRQSA